MVEQVEQVKQGIVLGALAGLLALGCDGGDDRASDAEMEGGRGKADDLDEETTGGEGSDGADPGAEDAVCAPDDTIAERLAACADAVDSSLLDPATRPTNGDDLLYYVNRWYSVDPCFPTRPSDAVLEGLRRDFVDPAGDREAQMLDVCGTYEQDLLAVPSGWSLGSVQLRRVAWERGFLPLFEAAVRAGHRLRVKSGFRSAETQKSTFQHWTDFEGGNAGRAAVYSAQPLHSEHQLGTTADVTHLTAGGQAIDPFADPVGLHESDAFTWIRAHAHEFGIVVTYEPHKVHLHQYKPEPWHLRYVGVEAATLLHACDLSTEELLSHRYSVALPLPEFQHIDLVHAAARADGWTEAVCFGAEPGSEPEVEPASDEPQPFCATHSVGGWCDGGDAVVCTSSGTEVQRRTCAQGCCTMAPGVADACREDLDANELETALSCTAAP